MFTVSSLVFLESVTNTVRLLFEFVMTEECACREMLAFTALLLATSVSIAQPFDDSSWLADVVDILPSIVLVLQLFVVRAYTYGIFLATVLLALGDTLRLDWVLVVGYAAQLAVMKQRSHMLRIAATGTLLYACVADLNDDNRRLVSLVGLELASWAMERYMLPWRVPASQTARCNVGCRFALGFFVGVHLTSGKETVYLRPSSHDTMTYSILGIAVHGKDAYLRYSTRPMGVLLAYLEGLQIIPYRMTYYADEHTVCVQLLWIECLVKIPLQDWSRASPEISFSAASRFPARRILVGLLLRL